MPATPKASRQPPPRTFENYVLTLIASPDINFANIPEKKFKPLGLASRAYADDALSGITSIGFDFLFDGITYNSFVASTNGWVALVDPALGTFSSSEVMTLSTFTNYLIKPTFTSNAVLLAPWFDDLRNLASDPNLITSNATARDRYTKGLQPKPISINKTEGVVRYANDDSSNGRRLVIRWSSLSDYITANAVLFFEVIIYENGTIEFRYKSKQTNTKSVGSEGATIGIFMPNGTNRFRDFSYGLGYRDNERKQYKYGGAEYSAAYSDVDVFSSVARPYSVNLNPINNWPGYDNSGATFIFAPPKNKRKILIKNELRTIDSQITYPEILRTGNRSSSTRLSLFDDRRTLIFVNAGRDINNNVSGALVNYPSKLNRFYGGTEPGAATRQDLFVGDFEITASVVKGVSDQYIENRFPQFIRPFSEDKLFENDQSATTDEFFISGSKIDLFGTSLKQPLKSKTHIKLSMPVEFNVKMPTNTSSIYYYNTKAASWNIPENSSYVTLINSVPVGTTKGDFANPLQDVTDSKIIEDHRGFGPIGNVICSGSDNRYGTIYKQSDPSINSSYSQQNTSKAIGKLYAKSVTNNEDYRANADEIFTLPIKHPFLIEKAVIEVPFAFGDEWFRDKTQCFKPLTANNNVFDFGGPAITIALYNQFAFDKYSSRRDLIMTGTLTHALDNVNEIVISNFTPDDSTYHIRPVGFKAYSGKAGAVVTPQINASGDYYFTGTVAVKSEAQISNGVLTRLSRYMVNGDANLNRSGVLDLFNTKDIGLVDVTSSYFSQHLNIAYVNNFGRGGSGFDPSGRSAFGKEFVTSNAVDKNGKITNPLYVSGGNGNLTFENENQTLTNLGLAQFHEAITSGTDFHAHMILPLDGILASPYLVQPGDSLILAISKTRPIFYGAGSTPHRSGSASHDVQLITGSINITFYGSLLRENSEFHDPLNQQISSVAVHEIVAGGEPILDQFECSYKESYLSGTYDDFIAGNMISDVTFFGKHLFVTGSFLGFTNNLQITSTGSRGRLFSKNNVRSNLTVPGTTPYDYNESLSYSLQPFFERAGTVRISQHHDNEERYWDSVMPSISQCFAADGKSIVIMSPTLWAFFANSSKVDVSNTGVLFFGYDGGTSSDTSLLPHFNRTWTWAYPFEPRYSKATREKNLNRSFVANYLIGPSFVDATPIPPVIVQKFFTGLIETTVGSNFGIKFFSDVSIKQQNLSGFYVTSSAGFSDTVKVLYGFGDHNNQHIDDTSNTGRWGSNNFPEHRQSSLGDGFLTSRHAFGPIIRGWKYGVYNGLPAFNKSYFRQGSYGQFRDMLEQRQYTKFYNESKSSTSTSAVTIRFVDVFGKTTIPERTWSQNLSIEATSSVPYFDGTIRNRPPIDPNMLNTTTLSI